jgi:hypothetical protein
VVRQEGVVEEEEYLIGVKGAGHDVAEEVAADAATAEEHHREH